MNLKKINLLNMDPEALSNFFVGLGEKSFRSRQVMRWIYRDYCDNFDQMTDLSKNLRLKLSQIAEIVAPVIRKEQKSLDGTMKWMMGVGDQCVETVYIPENNRITLCISSQIGCSMKCSFCATAQQGFNRNLQVSEIVGQIWRIGKLICLNKQYVKNNSRSPVTHVVFMGMGEPLLNLINVVNAIKIMLSDFGFGLSKNHVTLSTVGIVPSIDRLKDMLDIPLAVSLHAPNDCIRDKIIPINKRYNIHTLLSAVRRYIRETTMNRKRITIEYVLLKYINDKSEHAHELAGQLSKFPCKVNLIPWNPVPNTQYVCSSNVRINNFYKILSNYGIITTIRKIRGIDINAACGQLTGDVINRLRYNNNY